MKRTYLFVLLAGCSVVGCKSSTAPDTVPLFSLAVGDHWVLKFTNFSTTGMVSDSTFDTSSVTGTRVFGTKTYFAVKESKASDTGFVRQDNSGLWKFNRNTDSEQLQFKYPIGVGETFGKDTLYGEHLQNGNIVLDTFAGVNYLASNNKPVTVATGTYSCYSYEIDYKDIHDGIVKKKVINDVSPGVGLIQYTVDGWDGVSLSLYLASLAQLVSKNF